MELNFMDLKSLLTKDSVVEVKYPDPDLEGFVLKLQYMSKDVLKDIRKKATVTGFDKTSRTPTEILDDELFFKLYVQNAVKGWKGLKLKYLKELTLIDLGDQDPEAELEFTPENAVTLIENSTTFDAWLMSVISDVSVFNKPA